MCSVASRCKIAKNNCAHAVVVPPRAGHVAAAPDRGEVLLVDEDESSLDGNEGQDLEEAEANMEDDDGLDEVFDNMGAMSMILSRKKDPMRITLPRDSIQGL